MLLVRYAGSTKEPFADGIPPDNGMPRLVFEMRQNVRVALLIDATLQCFPLMCILRGALRTFVVRVVDVLNHGFARLQHVSVGHMMKEKQQLVRSCFQRPVYLGYWRRILPDVARAGSRCAIHADAVMVGAVPLPPSVVL